MPLDRAHLTVASRVMLPTYVAVCTLWGLAFILDPIGRLEATPSLEIARRFLPLEAWGGMWLALALVLLAARIRNRRVWAEVALSVACVTWAAWAVVIEASVFTNPNVTVLAGSLPAAWAVAHYASLRSLLDKER